MGHCHLPDYYNLNHRSDLDRALNFARILPWPDNRKHASWLNTSHYVHTARRNLGLHTSCFFADCHFHNRRRYCDPNSSSVKHHIHEHTGTQLLHSHDEHRCSDPDHCPGRAHAIRDRVPAWLKCDDHADIAGKYAVHHLNHKPPSLHDNSDACGFDPSPHIVPGCQLLHHHNKRGGFNCNLDHIRPGADHHCHASGFYANCYAHGIAGCFDFL